MWICIGEGKATEGQIFSLGSATPDAMPYGSPYYNIGLGEL